MEVGVEEGAVVIVVAVEAARARVGRRVRMVVVKCILKVYGLTLMGCSNARMRMRMRCLIADDVQVWVE